MCRKDPDELFAEPINPDVVCFSLTLKIYLVSSFVFDIEFW